MVQELPLVFYSLFPTVAAVAERESAGEWSAPCPKCGGRDRFRMFAPSGSGNPRYWCRVCNFKGFADSMTHRQVKELEEQRRLDRFAAEQERLEKLARLAVAQPWKPYVDEAGASDAWARRGISDEARRYFELGLARDRGALTIPFHNGAWAVETLQFRFLGVEGSGKYRFEPGYPASTFWTASAPDDWPFLILEGAIKAAVTFWRLCVEANRHYNVVAVPSKTPGRVVLERLGEDIGDRRAYVLLDPDATRDERWRVGRALRDARYVSLPVKVDDGLLMGLGPFDLERLYIAQATSEPL